ncbi:MAG: tRNA dihydrouridine synthase DusB [Casimicrobiaceae bacterium]|nr:tRNA dihydrouridine synthase DusB [Casimicrobiaceae bacterium]MDW8311216.1 tRNA dihydrouridine synthase DusB [Burkholderiales bacterium]
MFSLGPYRFANRLVVAPMAGVTDRPFRRLCRRLGAAHAISEMVASRPELWQTPKSMWRRDHSGEDGVITVQIVGSDPQMLAEAARFNVDRGAQVIDINMGCPKKKVCRAEAGSALLRDEALVARILEAVVRAVPVPVTLKMRTGWSKSQRNALAIAKCAEAAGIAAITLHGRTRECGFEPGTVEYDTIRAVKQAVKIPVIANGDIDSPAKAQAVLDYTGADAVMIGRAALGRPWIFRDTAGLFAEGRVPPPLRLTTVRELLFEHLDDHYGLYGEEVGVRSARKHLGWYLKSLPGGEAWRERLMGAETAKGQIAILRSYFGALACHHEVLPALPYPEVKMPLTSNHDVARGAVPA